MSAGTIPVLDFAAAVNMSSAHVSRARELMSGEAHADREIDRRIAIAAVYANLAIALRVAR